MTQYFITNHRTAVVNRKIVYICDIKKISGGDVTTVRESVRQVEAARIIQEIKFQQEEEGG